MSKFSIGQEIYYILYEINISFYSEENPIKKSKIKYISYLGTVCWLEQGECYSEKQLYPTFQSAKQALLDFVNGLEETC